MQARMSLGILTAWGIASLVGCSAGPWRCSDCVPPRVHAPKYIACVDDLVVKNTGRTCGRKALARYRKECGKVSSDFSAGFVQAHVDLAEGRVPTPPPVPPSRYWAAYYRSCAGKPRVEEWYAGYEAGLDVGLQSGVSQFRRVDVRLSGCSTHQ